MRRINRLRAIFTAKGARYLFAALLAAAVTGAFGVVAARAESSTYTVSGSFSWTAPEGVFSVIAEAWGAGGGAGGGGAMGGGGGGGGGYARGGIAVTPGNSYPVTVGMGGAGGPSSSNGSPGGESYFVDAFTVAASGGGPGGGNGSGAGSQGMGTSGETFFSGGAGAIGAAGYGGGGGGSAGSSSVGNSGSGISGGSSVYRGGPGGPGSTAGAGTPGGDPGGGGGGGFNNFSGASGRAGQVVVTYTLPRPGTPAVSAVSPNSIAVTWSATSTLRGYLVQVSTASNFTGVLFSSQTPSVSLSTLTVGDLAPNTSYHIRVGTLWSLTTYYASAISTSTVIETPTGIYFDEISTYSVTASVYAPALTGMERGLSAVNITTSAAYEAWGSTGNYWRARQDIATARNSQAAAGINGRLYVLGGTPDGTSYSSSNEAYDPVTNGWTTGANLPTGRSLLTAAVSGGRLYAIGGVNTFGIQAVNEEYDPISNAWRTLAPLPQARERHAAAALNGRVYVVGGNFGGVKNNLFEYDPAADSWTEKMALGVAKERVSAAALGGKLYIAGGFDSVSYRSDLEAYDPASNTWSGRASLPTARAGAAPGVIGGKLYVAAGYDGVINLAVNEAYDPQADAWTTMAPAPTAREGMAYGVVGGKFYLVSGNSGAFLKKNEEYSPGVSRSFTGLGPNRLFNFKAKARNLLGVEAAEVQSSTYTLAIATLPAGGQVFSSVGHSSVTVVWSSGSLAGGFNGPNASYLVQASTRPDFRAEVRYQTAHDSDRFTFDWLRSESTYYFRVQAYNSAKVTDHSWVLLGSTRTPKAPPEGVAVSTLTAVALNKLGLQSPMARDSQGNLYYAYTKLYNGRSRVFVARSSDLGKTWADTTPLPVENAGDVPAANSYDQYQPALAIDSNNGLHLVWGGANSTLDADGSVEPKCVYSSAPAPGVNWTQHVKIPGHTYGGNETNFYPVVDSQDGLHIVWSGYNCATPGCVRVRYSSRTADTAAWAAYQDINEDTFETGDFGVAMDRRNGLHLVAARAAGINTSVRPRLAYSFRVSTGGWTAWDHFFADGNGFSQAQPTLAMDPDGKLGAAWFSAGITSPNSQIKYSFKPYGGAWTAADIAQSIPEAPQTYPAIFADGSGKFYLLWSGSDTAKPMVKVKVSEHNGANWEPWDNAFSSDQIQLYPRVRWAGWRNNGGGLDISWSDYDGVSATATIRHLNVNDVPMFQGWTALAWPKPADCGYVVNVHKAGGGDFGRIQSAVDSLTRRLSTTTCVVLRDDQTYSEQVTVEGFEEVRYRLQIMKDPTFISSGPVVNPPTGSFAAFRVYTDSVTLQGIDIVSTNTVAYGVFSSSSVLSVYGANVISGGKISVAGIRLSSYSAVAYSSVTVQNADGLRLTGRSNAVSFSTIASGGNGNFAIEILAGDFNTVANSYVFNSAGWALVLQDGANSNAISYSTITGSGVDFPALTILDSDFNSVSFSYLFSSAGSGAHLNGADNTTFSASSLASGALNRAALYLDNSDRNGVADCSLFSLQGGGLWLVFGSDYNSVKDSTVTSASPDNSALYVFSSASNTIAGAYVQGSTAVYVSGSTDTVIGGSAFVATGGVGNALRVGRGSMGLSVSSTTLAGGPQGSAFYLAQGNYGNLRLSSSTITGGAYGLNLEPQFGSSNLSVSSITFASLTPGATAVNFLGGQFIMDVARAAFNTAAIGVNVNGGGLSAGSLVMMPGASGPRYGARYEVDPGSYIYWDLVNAQLVGPASGRTGVTPAAALYARAPAASTPVQYQYQVDTMPAMTAPPYSFDQTIMQAYSGQGAFSGQDSTTTAFGDSFLHTSTATFVFYSTTTPLGANMTYYWRARARTAEAGEFGPWTAINSFTTGQPAAIGPVNNLAVTDVALSSPSADGVKISFTLRENNVSTGTTPGGGQYNTADWVFVKFSTQAGADGTWQHATLTGANVASGGATVGSDNRGVFFNHTVSTAYWVAGATVTWNYAIDGVTGSNARVKVFAISMVKVPTGSFVYNAGGLGAATYNNFGGGSQANVTSVNDVPAGAPAGWPNGYNSFYVMRYELTQGLYADFLNTVHSSTAAVLYAYDSDSGHRMSYMPGNAYGWRYGAEDRFAAKNYLSTSDLWSFLSWSALRPMTEMEFEKAARDISPDSREYPWGDTEPTAATYNPRNEGGTHIRDFMNFYPGTPAKVLDSGRYMSGDVYRTPAQTGASPYGIADLAGNVYEHMLNCSYLSVPDNGTGTTAWPAGWPAADSGQKGLRGGMFTGNSTFGRISRRDNFSFPANDRYGGYGGRGARTP